MKNYLKILYIFALLFCTAQAYGQEMEGGLDDFDGFDNGFDWNEYWYELEDEDIGNHDMYCPGCPTVDYLKLMTYNLKEPGYAKNGKVIKASGADVVAVQEIRGLFIFYEILKSKAGMIGVRTNTVWGVYGIALLWKPQLDTPTITERIMPRPSGSPEEDPARAYIIAEFNDFCFISTHYSSGDANFRTAMSQAILDEDVVQNCINSGKPVYIAGDLNTQPFENEEAITNLTNAGFEILNNLTREGEDGESGKYVDKTTQGGRMIDLIFEYNKNLNHQTLWPHIPADADFTMSDHLPYIITKKFIHY
ncbi:MAG: endonuclease/exonuclease/phosphatase family protein [Prevotellaceae bacterium]|jgi:exonuclease III|nr:endonuclease/exonuclease/phosphatase family protein [Prevotellaceae bacterium]